MIMAGIPRAKPQQPTTEQWQEIAAKLDRMHDPVYLCCDGYLVAAMLERIERNRLGINVAVNGWRFKGTWFRRQDEGMPEESRRFWRPTKRQKLKKNELAICEKIHGKRGCKKRGYYDPHIWPSPTWFSPKSLIAHLCANNERIEILDYRTYQDAVVKHQAAEPTTEAPAAS